MRIAFQGLPTIPTWLSPDTLDIANVCACVCAINKIEKQIDTMIVNKICLFTGLSP